MSKEKQPNALERLYQDQFLQASKTRGTGGVLASLMRRILAETGTNYDTLIRRIDNYILMVRSELKSKKLASYFNRGNLIRAFAEPEMTWKSMFKLLRILGVSRVTFTVNLEYKSGRVPTVHKVAVDLGNYELEDDEEETA